MKHIFVEQKPVSIIMPVLENIEYTKSFFSSFYKNTSGDYEFIIINNGQDEETKFFLLDLIKKDNRIRVIQNEKNIGVSASWNQGIKESKNDFICILNNDIEIFTPNWIFEMQKCLQINENVYWASPSTCYTKDLKKRCFRSHHYEQLMYGSNIDNYIVGCCFMCPREAFDEIGLFDEDFDVKYYEDLDFINRILSRGKKVSMVKSVIVYHAVGATSRITKGGENNENRYNDKWAATPYDILGMQPNRVKGVKHFNR